MRLDWDQVGQRLYETGVSKGVLFLQRSSGSYAKGEAWNGLTNVTENGSGGESNKVYADNIPYLNLLSLEEFAASISAYAYPKSFSKCNGEYEVVPGLFAGQQKRYKFGMAYVSLIGNDTEETDYGYKIHLVYGASVTPSEKAHQTKNESPEATEFSWDLTTTPITMRGCRPTASITIDSTKTDKAKLKLLEDIIFGDEDSDSRLPLPDEVLSILGSNIIDDGKGNITIVSMPEDIVITDDSEGNVTIESTSLKITDNDGDVIIEIEEE